MVFLHMYSFSELTESISFFSLFLCLTVISINSDHIMLTKSSYAPTKLRANALTVSFMPKKTMITTSDGTKSTSTLCQNGPR